MNGFYYVLTLEKKLQNNSLDFFNFLWSIFHLFYQIYLLKWEIISNLETYIIPSIIPYLIPVM